MPEKICVLSVILHGEENVINELNTSAGSSIMDRIHKAIKGEAVPVVEDTALEKDVCEGVRIGDICIGRSTRD